MLTLPDRGRSPDNLEGVYAKGSSICRAKVKTTELRETIKIVDLGYNNVPLISSFVNARCTCFTENHVTIPFPPFLVDRLLCA